METNNSFFNEDKINRDNNELKSFIINFELESGDSRRCISEGNTSEEAINNAIVSNPNGKNFTLAPKPLSGILYGRNVNNNNNI